jgi:hypothetical protein
MPLFEDLQSAKTRLSHIQTARGDFEETQKLGALRTDLQGKLKRLAPLQSSIAVLRTNGVRVGGISISNASTKLESAADKFDAAPRSVTLKTGTRWTQLIESLDIATDHIANQRDEAWTTFLTTLFSGSPPEQLEAQLPKTPANTVALQKYRKLYPHYIALRNAPAQTQEAVDTLKKYSEELGAIRFEQDVPADVNKFLEAAATSMGFPLGGLTPTILDWLLANNLANSYVVRKRLQ